MIVVAILVGLLAVVAGLVAILNNEAFREKAIFATAGLALASLFLFFASCICIVKAGSVGVPVLFGSVQGTIYPEGMHFMNPFVSVHQMSVRTENYWMSHDEMEGNTTRDDSVAVRSSNGLQMPVDLSVPYRLIPDAAPWVYQNLGDDYVEKLLRVSLSTAARRAASSYTAEQLYSTKRDDFARKTQTILEEELNKILQVGYKDKGAPEQVLVVSQVLVGHVGIPETVKGAIEAKLKADQEQQSMDFRIMREKKEAERKRVEAEGIQKFQEIVAKGIDDRLLRWKAIDATVHLAESKNAKIIIIGSGRDGLPVLLGSDGEVHLQKK
jgi:regulator of protease activity HflC (stomatin/prohibitin superfamily)